MEKTSLSGFSYPAGGNFPSHLLATPTSLTCSAHLCTQLTCKQYTLPVPHCCSLPCETFLSAFSCQTFRYRANPSLVFLLRLNLGNDLSFLSLTKILDLCPSDSCLPIKAGLLVSVPAACSLSDCLPCANAILIPPSDLPWPRSLLELWSGWVQ